MKEKTENKPTTQEEGNQHLHKAMFKDTELKEIVVAYVGSKADKEEVTVEMIVEAMAEEFPEFLLAIAEENWIRGYKQALDDVEKDIDFINSATVDTDNEKLPDEKVSN